MIPFLQVWDLSLEGLYHRSFERSVSLRVGLSAERKPRWVFPVAGIHP